MADQQNTYTFSERERAYFDRLLAQFRSSVASGVSMICTQQDFAGQWRVNVDGSGIERVDVEPAGLEAHAVA